MSSRRDLPQPFNLAKSINSFHYSSSGEILHLANEVIGSGFAGVTTNNLYLIGDSASDLSAVINFSSNITRAYPPDFRDSGSWTVRSASETLFRNYDEHLSQMSVGHDKSPGFPRDSYGNRVIQKCLNQLPSEDNQFIYNAVSANCIEVASDRYGSRVLQRCINHGTESQRTQLMEEIKQDWLVLVQDRFGNYTVPCCLDLSDGGFTKAIVRRFLGKIRDLSVQKLSSNVVEKCIRVADPIAKRAIIDEILADNFVKRLLLDELGNYICQTALELAEPDQRAMLIHHIIPILSYSRHTPHGRRIQSKITRENIHHMNRGGRFHHGLTGGRMGLVGISLAPLHQLVPGHHISNISWSPYFLPGSLQYNPLTGVVGFSNDFASASLSGIYPNT
ncbi:ARM repeat-containing protein [Atractiella rhizophila]|nr:ARM repeat-containing protein [Atractiella rhizophila]